jgi:hypothetical protein
LAAFDRNRHWFRDVWEFDAGWLSRGGTWTGYYPGIFG